MKNANQVKQKLKQVIFRHRKNYIKEGLRIRGTLGDSSICSCDITSDCEHPDCVRKLVSELTNEEYVKILKIEFQRSVGGKDCPAVPIGEISKKYPDIAALLWVLDYDHSYEKTDKGRHPLSHPNSRPKGVQETSPEATTPTRKAP